MRLIDPRGDPTSYKLTPHACGVKGCRSPTRDGKPFCPEHVHLNPHGGRVTAEIAARAAEDAMVRAGRMPTSRYNLGGITAQSILRHLSEYGVRTQARVCMELRIDEVVLDGYLKALIKRKMVRLETTKRGKETLSLVRPLHLHSDQGYGSGRDMRSSLRAHPSSS